MEFSNEIINLTKEAEKALEEQFKKIDETAFINTSKVMDAFRENRVSDSIFAGSTGYGYDDKGRETLDKVFAYMFDAPAALVRHTIANGTAAISAGLYALLRPGDIMLSVTGKPYDTLLEAIGILGEEGNGSLKDFGVIYDEIELDGGRINFSELEKKLSDKVKVVYIQRSKGYSTRPTLSSEEIGEVVSFVKKRSNAFVVVDNCYGEFCETKEPTAYQGGTFQTSKEIPTMSKIELLAKIELLNKYEAMIEEMKGEADTIRNSIKAEMEAREVEELIAGQYIVRWATVLSNRFDSTAFKKVMPEVYKAYTKQTTSRRFTISV